MGARVCVGQSGKYGGAASEGELRQRRDHEYADDQRAGELCANDGGYVESECVVEHGSALSVDYAGNDGERGRGPDEPDC